MEATPTPPTIDVLDPRIKQEFYKWLEDNKGAGTWDAFEAGILWTIHEMEAYYTPHVEHHGEKP